LLPVLRLVAVCWAAGWYDMNTATADDRFDPFVAGFLDDPYRHYAGWRRAAPLHRGVSPDSQGSECWYILDYATARQALVDDRLGLEFQRVVPQEYLLPPPAEFSPFFTLIRHWFIFRDPPDHTRLRRLFAPAFTKDALGGMTQDIDSIAAQLCRNLSNKREIDLIADFALPLPVMVIGLILGMDVNDLELLKAWSHALLVGIDLKRADDAYCAYAKASCAATELGDYLEKLIAARRRAPRDDLLSSLVSNPDCDDSELAANCALLLFAGHETTVNLIGNGMLALLSNPAELQLLRDDARLLPTAIEEMARYDSPSQMTFRFAMERHELGGSVLQPGEPVGIVIGAANRDAAQFQDPDRFDVCRWPNRHLSFGAGRHACLGGLLARIEARAAFQHLLANFRQMERSTATSHWSPSRGLRGLASLPIRVTAG
jgi:cytochrome P450